MGPTEANCLASGSRLVGAQLLFLWAGKPREDWSSVPLFLSQSRELERLARQGSIVWPAASAVRALGPAVPFSLAWLSGVFHHRHNFLKEK